MGWEGSKKEERTGVAVAGVGEGRWEGRGGEEVEVEEEEAVEEKVGTAVAGVGMREDIGTAGDDAASPHTDRTQRRDKGEEMRRLNAEKTWA